MWNREFRSEAFDDPELIYHCLRLLKEKHKSPTYVNLHQEPDDFFALLDHLKHERYINGYGKSELKSGIHPNFTNTTVLQPGLDYINFHDEYADRFKEFFG